MLKQKGVLNGVKYCTHAHKAMCARVGFFFHFDPLTSSFFLIVFFLLQN